MSDATPSSVFTQDVFTSPSLVRPTTYSTLRPAASATKGLPLILHLHGAFSDSSALSIARGRYEDAWASGRLPPALVACVSTPTIGGFYIDQTNGERWETLVGQDFPGWLRKEHGLAARRVLIGFSMGGFGALKIAFADPCQWSGVAALCPVVFPAERLDAVPPENRPSILNDLNNAMAAAGDGYVSQTVYGRLRANVAGVRTSRLPIFLDCGIDDEFRLHDGASYLHNVLDRLAVPHTYREVHGAAHADQHVDERLNHALCFLGEALR